MLGTSGTSMYRLSMMVKSEQMSEAALCVRRSRITWRTNVKGKVFAFYLPTDGCFRGRVLASDYDGGDSSRRSSEAEDEPDDEQQLA